MIKEVNSVDELNVFGAQLASLLGGGDVIELVGDVGAGKTTLTKAIAKELGVQEDVQSPSFTISRIYLTKDNLRLAHYDFYQLTDSGIMKHEFAEVVRDEHTITIVEWGAIVEGILPVDRLQLTIVPTADSARRITIESTGPKSAQIETRL
jgi:tRNA threonylcarbamoyladenosine biosynthesis protein TsaE